MRFHCNGIKIAINERNKRQELMKCVKTSSCTKICIQLPY